MQFLTLFFAVSHSVFCSFSLSFQSVFCQFLAVPYFCVQFLVQYSAVSHIFLQCSGCIYLARNYWFTHYDLVRSFSLFCSFSFSLLQFLTHFSSASLIFLQFGNTFYQFLNLFSAFSDSVFSSFSQFFLAFTGSVYRYLFY